MTNTAKGLRITTVAPSALTGADIAEWDELFDRQSAPSNPFLNPTWVLSWYNLFSEHDDRFVIMVRHAVTNDLLGVAPMHRQTLRVGPIRIAHRLVMVGIGVGPNPFELPGFLAHPDHSRDVARAIVNETLDSAADWCELAIDPNQGWFEPEWTYGRDEPATFSQYQRPRACVVLPLKPTWDELRTTFKRNIKESVRRSQNRLANSGRRFSLNRQTGESVTVEMVGHFLDLHRMRSHNDRASVHHPDAFADARHRDLLLSVVPKLAVEGRASIIELEIEGVVLASQLVLMSPSSSYIHSSGFHPDIWAFGPVTYLHAEVIKAAIDRGDSVVNFSPGPNVSKLRWSEQLWVTNEFAYGSGPKLVGYKFGAHQAMSAVRASMSAFRFVKKTATATATAGNDSPSPRGAAHPKDSPPARADRATISHHDPVAVAPGSRPRYADDPQHNNRLDASAGA